MSTITAGSTVTTRTGVVGVVNFVDGDTVSITSLTGTGLPTLTTVTRADIVAVTRADIVG